MSDQKRCGTCQLWGVNFYEKRISFGENTTCCADAVMDLPASFIPERQTMTAEQGEGCICWEPISPPAPVELTADEIPF